MSHLAYVLSDSESAASLGKSFHCLIILTAMKSSYFKVEFVQFQPLVIETCYAFACKIELPPHQGKKSFYILVITTTLMPPADIMKVTEEQILCSEHYLWMSNWAALKCWYHCNFLFVHTASAPEEQMMW